MAKLIDFVRKDKPVSLDTDEINLVMNVFFGADLNIKEAYGEGGENIGYIANPNISVLGDSIADRAIAAFMSLYGGGQLFSNAHSIILVFMDLFLEQRECALSELPEFDMESNTPHELLYVSAVSLEMFVGELARVSTRYPEALLSIAKRLSIADRKLMAGEKYSKVPIKKAEQ